MTQFNCAGAAPRGDALAGEKSPVFYHQQVSASGATYQTASLRFDVSEAYMERAVAAISKGGGGEAVMREELRALHDLAHQHGVRKLLVRCRKLGLNYDRREWIRQVWETFHDGKVKLRFRP